MAVRLETAAKHLCELSGWTLSNLALQKLLYLSQVEYANLADGESLIPDRFQAWDYGPVIPRLYRKLKMFGASPVDDVFYNSKHVKRGSTSEKALDLTWECFGEVDPGELIEVSHWGRGGWAQRYQPGVKNIDIRQDDIIAEARNRTEFAAEWERIIAA